MKKLIMKISAWLGYFKAFWNGIKLNRGEKEKRSNMEIAAVWGELES